MVGDLLDLAKTLFGLKSDLNKSLLERRQRLATYLDGVVGCLGDILSELNQGEKPFADCSELKEYLRLLTETVGKEVGEDRLARYEDVLFRAAEGKRIAITLYDLDPFLEFSENQAEFQQAIQVLEDAYGTFKALANSLRI